MSMSAPGCRSQSRNSGREPWRIAWPPASRRLQERVAASSPQSNRHARNASRVSPRAPKHCGFRKGTSEDLAECTSSACLPCGPHGMAPLAVACPGAPMHAGSGVGHGDTFQSAGSLPSRGTDRHRSPASSAIRGTPAEGLADGEVVSERGMRELPFQSVAPNQYAIRVLRLGWSSLPSTGAVRRPRRNTRQQGSRPVVAVLSS